MTFQGGGYCYECTVAYELGDYVWLSSRNIKTARPSTSLENRQLGPFEVIQRVGTSYRLRISDGWRKDNVFHPKLLRPYANDPLPGQARGPPRAIQLDEGDEYAVDDILDSRRYRGRLQYKVKWEDVNRDDTWYYADADQFANVKDVVDEFHKHYPGASR